MPRASRVASLAVAAIVVLGACGSDADGTAEPTPTKPSTAPSTTAPDPDTVPTAPPTTSPTPTSSPVASADQRYEVLASIIEEGDGPHLCYVVLESAPPQCGSGLQLVDWSWDAIDVEQSIGSTTWVDPIYVAGTFDPATQTFTVAEARLPSDADRERLTSRPLPDYTVPCSPPAGGWPARTQEWPTEEIAELDGYAGAWVDEGQSVMTVSFTGDLAAAEAAVREHYADALCVVGAEHSAAELSAIVDQLNSMDSVQFLSTSVYVDASGEWIEAQTIAPDAARQAAFVAEFGPGVVRLQSLLRPIAED